MSLLPGAKLGPYQIVAPLGSGGMGEVYRAHDTRLGRDVAIKVLPAEFAADPDSQAGSGSSSARSRNDRLRRFEQEARAASALNHPNILVVHDVGTHEGAPYLVTELLEGESFRERLRNGALPARKAIDLATQVASGLAAAHEKGIVHRDLKPENLFVSRDGHVKILDFGLAKLVHPPQDAAAAPTVGDITTPGTLLGTVAYMSPEQVRAQSVDHRSDIFSLGVVLYELVTGRQAFGRGTAADTMSAILKEEPPEPSALHESVPLELSRAITHCLEKHPAERFQSARDLAYALRAIAAASPPAHVSAVLVEPPDDRPSIAVLPFANLSADAGQEYFCDGMVEEIINALAHVHGLRVIARTSAFAFKGRSEDIRAIGTSLDVATLLEGSVRKAGDRLRITAQLISVADGSHLWSERYDRRLEDVFAIQEEIALAIVANLKVRLIGRERAAIERRSTENLEAYSAHLKGLYHWNKLSPEGFALSRECFEAAIRIDPGYAPAHSGLAMWYMSGALWGGLLPQEAWQQCKGAVEKTLSFDPESAMALTGLGCVLAFFERRWQAGEEAMRRGVRLGPNAPMTHNNLATLLVIRRSREEAATEARIALRLDPLSVPNCVFGAAWIDAAGYHEEGRAELDRVIALDPTHWFPHWQLSHVAARGGRLEEVLAEGEKAVQLSGGASVAMALLACGCYAVGDRHRGEDLRTQLEERARNTHVPPSFFAWMDAARQETDGAVRWLERAADSRDPWFVFYRMNAPAFVGTDPRIEAVLSRFGL